MTFVIHCDMFYTCATVKCLFGTKKHQSINLLSRSRINITLMLDTNIILKNIGEWLARAILVMVLKREKEKHCRLKAKPLTKAFQIPRQQKLEHHAQKASYFSSFLLEVTRILWAHFCFAFASHVLFTWNLTPYLTLKNFTLKRLTVISW